MLGRSGMNRIIAGLVMLLIGTSFTVIFHQQEIRKLNIELEKQKSLYSDLKLEYQRLELSNTKENITSQLDDLARAKEEAKNPKPATVPTANTGMKITDSIKIEQVDNKPQSVEVKEVKSEKSPEKTTDALDALIMEKTLKTP